MATQKAPEQEDYTPDLMTLEDEDGNEATFEVITQVEYGGKKYLAATLEEEENAKNDEAQMVIFRIDTDAQGEFLDIVDDEEELLAVGDVVEKKISEYFEVNTDAIKNPRS